MKYRLLSFALTCSIVIKAQEIKDTLRDYHANGRLSIEYPMMNGKNHGLCRTWYNNGQLSSSGWFLNGGFDSVQNWWYENGKMKMYSNYINSCQTEVISWYPNGAMQWKYKTNEKRTETMCFTEQRILLYHVLYKNGQPYTCGSIMRTKGDTSVFVMPDRYPCNIGTKNVFVTKNIVYDSFGNEIPMRFKRHILMWYANGQPQSKRFFKNGKLHGKVKEWDASGNLKIYQIYRRGKLIVKKPK